MTWASGRVNHQAIGLLPAAHGPKRPHTPQQAATLCRPVGRDAKTVRPGSGKHVLLPRRPTRPVDMRIEASPPLGIDTDREKVVLKLRFGLEDGHPRTLEEVGRVFNVTRERIRQIEAKALRKLKHPTRAKKLREYLK